MSVDLNQALRLVKTRLNRLQSDTALDSYFEARISAVVSDLEKVGIHLTDSIDDLLLVVDSAVWAYQNRDNPSAMPAWLRLKRRERWLQQTRNGGGGDDS